MGQLSVEQAIAEARSGSLRPVYLVAGEERYLRRVVLEHLRRAVLGSEQVSLNEDRFTAGDVDAATVIAAARTLPMFGPRRLVIVQGVERWEAQKDASAKGIGHRPLDRLAQYAADPSDSTTLVLVADKLDNRRKLMSVAKKAGFLVACAPLSRGVLPGWIRDRCTRRGHAISHRAADLLAELVGSDLAMLDDAVERVTLYVGPQKDIGEEDILTCVANLKSTTVWELVEAVGRREPGPALAALGRVFERGSGPRLVGLLCWSARQLIRFGSARATGINSREAAKVAGIPPFKAQEFESQLRAMSLARAELWLEKLAEVDRAMKGGSKLPPRAVLEQALLDICRVSLSR